MDILPDYEFEYVAGDLSLDFVNTVSGDRASGHEEHLVSFPNLVAWASRAGVLDVDQAQSLLRKAQSQPQEADRALAHAVDVREIIYRIFTAAIQDKAPSTETLDAFNRELERSLRRQQVHLHGKELHMGWDLCGEELDGFLAPVVASAASLLTSDSLELVKICGGDSCGWMFVDRSKNHSRRWCTMKDCGNVAKVRRFRGRTPGKEGTA